MKTVLQRVSEAELSVLGEQISFIGKGLLILLGIEENDSENDAKVLCDKIVNLRIFEDSNGKMNKSVLQENGEIMIVSNFTLYADCRKGRRPSFVKAARPDKAKNLYEDFINKVKKSGIKKTAYGIFGADMQISLVNNGPVTIILDSNDLNGVFSADVPINSTDGPITLIPDNNN